jgi:hypothetical protein
MEKSRSLEDARAALIHTQQETIELQRALILMQRKLIALHDEVLEKEGLEPESEEAVLPEGNIVTLAQACHPVRA